ncbi:putative leucine-rich repeat protein [Trypanosoma grayi]|uniref:putative leucine-rich repeat protein n=1 Tax=Trypanosoma grayi TaxID=71804 RepID=UPI0004F4A256|nr:putative leucine-rich repeat protein [Trypanosoma grayi]KEG10495.1 putative leucine-rich repeat protein [Trypanosoma grayi]
MTEVGGEKFLGSGDDEAQNVRSMPNRDKNTKERANDGAKRQETRGVVNKNGQKGESDAISSLSASATLSGQVKVGSTVYQRTTREDESGFFGGGTVAVWTQEGKPTDEGWAEVTLESGDVVYMQWGSPSITRWQLPDPPRVQNPTTVAERSFDIKKDWAEQQRKLVRTAAAKALDDCVFSRGEEKSMPEAERAQMVQNIANEYMVASGANGYDESSDKWLRRAAGTEVDTLLAARRMTKTAGWALQQQPATLVLQAKLGLVGYVSREVDGSAAATTATEPLQDEEELLAPESPFLPCARFLRDPYYASLLGSPCARRGCNEPRLEATTFAVPGSGEVRVLCAVTAYEGFEGPQTHLYAVARDWTGAFCLFVLEPFHDAVEATVLSAYPLLDSIELSPVSNQRVDFRVDGTSFVASFKDKQHTQWFHDALKAAMASMYGEGNDSERIVKMRAYSVEFAAHYTHDRSTNLLGVLHAILSETEHVGAMMDDNFAQLRICLRTPQGRDQVSQRWLDSSAKLLTAGAAACPAAVANHLRMMEELMKCPTPHMDGHISGCLQDRLKTMGRELPECTAKCARLSVLLGSTEAVMLKWASRYETPDVPFEPCFQPLPHSQAAEYEGALFAKRRVRTAAYRHSPGIYLAVLCFCGDKLLTDKSGRLIAEVIQPEPTRAELLQLTADCEDYRWLLRLGGADENWAEEKLQEWAAVYEERGTESFKGRFIRAASRLRDTKTFPTLGCIFDTPILQEEAGSAFVLTVCEVKSEDMIVPSVGIWRDVGDVERVAYTQSLMCPESARVVSLSSRYRNCVRYVDAAAQYRASLTERLAPGFYLGFFLSSVSAEGMTMLVPECNRNLPPLVKVSSEPPSLQQWRWLQSLNYRQQTLQTFGLPAPEDLSTPLDEDAPFESKVGHAVAALEAAVGLRVQQFYDLELFALDEEQSIYAFFAVAYYPPPLPPLGASATAEAPKGLVPMTFKLVRVVDDHHQRRYWHRVYDCLADETDLAYRNLCVRTQPFTSDEVMRLNPANEAMLYAVDLDRYALLLSWARTLAIWVETDGLTLVQKYAERLLERTAGTTTTMTTETKKHSSIPSIEEVVDIAVSNQAAAMDPNLFAMKSLMLQLKTGGKGEWVSILQRLQDIDDTMTEGYAGRVALSTRTDNAPIPLRSFDEVPVEDGLCAARPPTVYELPCSLMEFVSGGDNVAEAHLFAREIVDDIIDVAVTGGEVAALGRVVEMMVTCVETAEDMTDGVVLERLRADAEEAAWAERQAFLQEWGELCNAQRRPSSFDDALDAAVEAPEPLFSAGSQQRVLSASDGVRVCLARAAEDADRLQELLRVANSALHSLELVQCLREYNDTLQKREQALFGQRSKNDGDKSHHRNHHLHNMNNTNDKGVEGVLSVDSTAVVTRPRLVTLVSREQREIPLYALDPFRCLKLHGDRIRVPFLEFGYTELRVLGDHMNAPEEEVAAQLRDLDPPADKQKRMLHMALELQAPLLALRLFPLVYCRATGRFGDEAASAVREVVRANDFFLRYGVRDWLQLETLGGPAIASGMDVLWWLRYQREAGDGAELYSSYSGAWKQVYAETRVRLLLSRGASRVSEAEASLWFEGLGRHVAFISFKGQTHVADAEVAMLAAACPLLQSLDLSGTAVMDESVRLLDTRCKCLVECSVAGSRVSREAAARLSDICMRNARNR